ncbi:hypothetical protein [Flavivirga eckloniae]|uniref:F5/8 type C domain-containing protein n=1 Tax=Flavivirga eckloniae TaxID=1803846 RepID=A0A2K9PN68_9FLAO|nr:hypothetical protein [Flavivirga eckloniae]AUP78502.1 hypothetical protein C1H87_07170 [Flavivirga eckloniae]
MKSFIAKIKFFIHVKRTKLYCLFLFALFYSCSDIPSKVKDNLNLARDNKKELETVINHYKAPKDSLKLKAAYFLIENMLYNYSLDGPRLQSFNNIFSIIEEAEKETPFKKDLSTGKFIRVDSIWNDFIKKEGFLSKYDLDVKPDLYYIKSEFLIENIEYAFKAWGLPWSKHLSFHEFCEYILPYRYRDEAISSWRPLFFDKYQSLVDSLVASGVNDPLIACKAIKRKLAPTRYCLLDYPTTMSAANMLKTKMGNCVQEAGLAVFGLRALGVPATHEQIPHHGSRSLGHDFNGVLDKEGTFVDLILNWDRIGAYTPDKSRRIPKIYRKTFSYNKNSLASLNTFNEEVPVYFKNPNIVDATGQYLENVDVDVKLTMPIPNNNKFVYLCVFNNKDWVAVDWARINENKVVFENVGVGVAYSPMYFHNNTLIPAAPPVLIDSNGNIKKNDPIQKEQSMVLKRKYTPDKSYAPLIHGKFQAANNKSFNNPVDLHQIRDTLDLIYYDVSVENPKQYRYVRYLFPEGSNGLIAEIAFFSEKDTKLTGNIIAAENIKNDVSIKKAFDENVLSFVSTVEKEKNQWIGLDFGRKQTVSKISFCPRSDKNDVWPGLNYELFYWENGWESLGIKEAINYQLEYKSPISGGLYLLKCLDEGKEERIFTYENGKQIWW